MNAKMAAMEWYTDPVTMWSLLLAPAVLVLMGLSLVARLDASSCWSSCWTLWLRTGSVGVRAALRCCFRLSLVVVAAGWCFLCWCGRMLRNKPDSKQTRYTLPSTESCQFSEENCGTSTASQTYIRSLLTRLTRENRSYIPCGKGGNDGRTFSCENHKQKSSEYFLQGGRSRIDWRVESLLEAFTERRLFKGLHRREHRNTYEGRTSEHREGLTEPTKFSDTTIYSNGCVSLPGDIENAFDGKMKFY